MFVTDVIMLVAVVVVAGAAVDCCLYWWFGEKHALLTTCTTCDDVPSATQINAQLPQEQELKEAMSHVVLQKDSGQKVYQASWSSQARAVVKHTLLQVLACRRTIVSDGKGLTATLRAGSSFDERCGCVRLELPATLASRSTKPGCRSWPLP